MKPQVLRASHSDEFFTEERCHILELSNSPSDPGMSIARTRVEPGVTTALHRIIDTVERYIILSGSGRVDIEGLVASNVEQYDVVIIPKGAKQRITNTADVDLVFLAICTPRFDQKYYEQSE